MNTHIHIHIHTQTQAHKHTHVCIRHLLRASLHRHPQHQRKCCTQQCCDPPMNNPQAPAHGHHHALLHANRHGAQCSSAIILSTALVTPHLTFAVRFVSQETPSRDWPQSQLCLARMLYFVLQPSTVRAAGQCRRI